MARQQRKQKGPKVSGALCVCAGAQRLTGRGILAVVERDPADGVPQHGGLVGGVPSSGAWRVSNSPAARVEDDGLTR